MDFLDCSFEGVVLFSLLAAQNVDGGAELFPLVLLDLAAVDEGSEVSVGISGRIELTGAFFEVGGEFRSIFDVGDRATGGARDSTNESLVATLCQHVTDGGIVGVDDDVVRDHAAQRGVGMSRGIEHFRIDATDAFFRVTGLDGSVTVLGDADSAHGEEAGRSLCVAVTEAVLASATAESFFNLAALAIDDVYALGRGIDDVEPSGVVVGVAGGALGCNVRFDRVPVDAEKLGSGRGGGATLRAGLEQEESEREERGLKAGQHWRELWRARREGPFSNCAC